jgi:hypothetical protein
MFAGVVLLGLFTLSVVLPNSLKEISISLLIASAFILPMISGLGIFRNRFFLFLLLSIPITILYLVIGYQNGAPNVALVQIPIIYILTPILWGVVCCAVRSLLSPKAVVSWLVAGIWLCGLTVIYFFIAFFTFGPDAVSLFAAEPNLGASAEGYVTVPTAPNLGVTAEGFVAATMQVYGSLIFLTGGLFAAPDAIRNRLLRFLTIGLAIAMALTSGRSALILAIPIGMLVYGLGMLRDRHGRFSAAMPVKMIFAILGSVAAVASVTIVFSHFLNWNLTADIDSVLEKLSASGDEERRAQMTYLLNGIVESDGLGAGHGVPASVIRLPQFPWRYELLWFATVYRVGIVGAAIYALPFVVALWRGGASLIQGRLSVYERFIFGGFVSAFAASNSNPYLEGYVFQWMVILPLVYFLAPGRIRSPSKVASGVRGLAAWPQGYDVPPGRPHRESGG